MTTIVLVRKNNEVVVAGDGQVSMGNTVIKKTANKVRKIEKRNVIAGFAGQQILQSHFFSQSYELCLQFS